MDESQKPLDEAAPAEETPMEETKPTEPTGITEPTEPVEPAVADAPQSTEPADSVQPEETQAQPVIFTSEPAKKPKKTWMLALIVIAAILLLGGGAVAAYMGIIVPNQPKNIVARAIGNTVSGEKITSAAYEGEFSAKDGQSGQAFAGTMTGAGDGKNAEFNVSMGISLVTIKLEGRLVDNNGYVKVDGLQGLPQILAGSDSEELSTFAPLIQAVNGQWISFDSAALKSAGLDVSQAGRLSDADAKKVEDIYKKHLFFDVTKTYSDEKIHGADSHHYKVTINETQLNEFAKELKEAKIKNLDITSDMLSQLKSAHLGKYPIELWVSKDTTTIDQVSFSTTQDNMTVRVRVAATSINKPVTIAKPTGAKTLLQVIGDNWNDISQLIGGTGPSDTLDTFDTNTSDLLPLSN